MKIRDAGAVEPQKRYVWNHWFPFLQGPFLTDENDAYFYKNSIYVSSTNILIFYKA